MSNLKVGSKVVLHIQDKEHAATKAIHVIDEKQPLSAEVVYVHESGNVNVIVLDQVGTLVPLLDVQTTKPKEDNVFYVAAVK